MSSLDAFSIDIAGTGGGLQSSDGVASKNYKKRRKHRIQDITRGVVATADGARQAGLHPAFVMGAGTHTPAPVPIGVQQGNSATASFGGSKKMSPQEAEAHALNMELQQKKIDYTQELIDSSRASRARTDENVSQDQFDQIWQSYGDADVTGQLPIKTKVEPEQLGNWRTGKSPTAQQIEDQYGDIIQFLYGTGRFTVDALDNLWRKLRSPRYKTRDPGKSPRYREKSKQDWEISP